MSSRISKRNRRVYALIVRAAQRAERRSDDETIGLVGVAATYAASNCVGMLHDPSLQGMLGSGHTSGSVTGAQPTDKSSSVLHVATALHETGGHTRLMHRWINLDCTRRHSVFLTASASSSIPDFVNDAVEHAGGDVRNATGSTPQEQAAELRDAAAGHRYVVLHVNPSDPISALAFGSNDPERPVLFVDHADHLFWIAPAGTSLLVSLRADGATLARDYRGIGNARIAQIPLPLEPYDRVTDERRAAAKHELGIPNGDVLAVTCAAAYKFRDGVMGLPGFVDLILPVLETFPRVHLVAIGPDPDEETWADAARRTGGRMRAIGTTPDTSTHRDGADIYIDSFPFGSGTSILESAARGTPALAFRFAQPELGVFSVGDPRLEGALPRASDPYAYRNLFVSLVEDSELRALTGQALYEQFRDDKRPTWRERLEEVYRQADSASLTPFQGSDVPRATPHAFDEMLTDLLHQYRPGLWAPLARNRSLLSPRGQRHVHRSERVVAAATKLGLGRRKADAVGGICGLLYLIGQAFR